MLLFYLYKLFIKTPPIIVIFALPTAFCQTAISESRNLQEVLYDVTINGVKVGENVLFLAGDKNHIYARTSDLKEWRLQLPAGSVFQYGLEPGDVESYAPLGAFQNISYVVDSRLLELSIAIDTRAFEKTILFKARARVLPQAATGAYLNYDFVQHIGSDRPSKLDGLLELNIFDPHRWGVLRNNLLVNDLFANGRITRLETSWRKDLVDRRESVIIGDTLTSANTLSRPFRFAGLQWGTNFSVNPAFVTFPSSSIGGLAELASTVDVYVDDVLRASSSVKRGPFELERLAVISSEGDIRLVVTDLLGRQQEITQAYFFNPENLASGLSDFSYSAGFKRKNFGFDSYNYEKPFLSLNHRYGFSDKVTGEFQFEATSGLQATGIAGGIVIPDFGKINPKVMLSNSDSGLGYTIGFGYDYIRSVVNMAFQTEYASRNFRRLGGSPGGTTFSSTTFVYSSQFRFGLYSRKLGSLSLAYAQRNNREADKNAFSTVNYSKHLSFGSLSLTIIKTIKPVSNYAITLNFSIFPGSSPGSRQTASVTSSYRNDKINSALYYSLSRGSSYLGTNHQLRVERRAGTERYSTRNVFRNSINRLSADTTHVNGAHRARLNVSGAVAWLGGDVFYSQPIHQGFSVVDTDGINDIAVYHDNRKVGKTNAKGRLMVSGLGAYRANRLSIDADEIPFNTNIQSHKATAVPYAFSGVLTHFPVSVTQHITVTLVGENGRPVPANAIIHDENGQAVGRVAIDGYSYLSSTQLGNTVYTVNTGYNRCTFSISLDDSLEILADLGTIRCQ